MRTSSSRDRDHFSDEENPYWVSFSDIMAGLLVIFIMAAVALIIELTQKSQEWDEAIREIAKAEQVRRDLLREIVAELNAKNIPVKISDNDTVLRIPEDVLTFAQRQYEIADTSQEITLEIGKVLHQSITKNSRWKYLDTIFIEGHTDKMPYRNSKMKGNWGLSTFRAISVWDFWNINMAEQAKLNDLRNHDGHHLFSVSGYAETRPEPQTLEDPDSDESLGINRRIDIRFTVRRPALEEYEEIKKALK